VGTGVVFDQGVRVDSGRVLAGRYHLRRPARQGHAGIKTGKKENPKPLVEKVAEAKPVEDAVGKITEKAPVITDTSPPPQPKVEPKPVEKKPDPPKPVAEKPKEEPKPEKKQEQPKVDPIAEALKKEEKKPPPKPVAQAAKPPEATKPKTERPFDQSKIAALWTSATRRVRPWSAIR
jgi:hypothetical protein